ncbi:UNVERIFIED_CONTAM: hypothetical protein Sradi_1186600 [Sesamum radiatum]|uniref:Methyltransferase type 11 domain-containing protein n=1 Tax=Sesamum radiatum TaxID=300843 RepID=A0AAW2UQX7_SESRA
MDFKFLKWHLLRGPLIRRVVLRAFVLVLAVIVVSLMQMAREVRVIESIAMNVDKCPLNLDSNLELNLTGFLNSASTFALPLFGASPVPCNVSENLTKIVLKEMMEKNLLQSNARALCVGERSASAVLALRHLGFFNAFGVDRHPFFSLLKRRFVYELNFDDNHFDFVFSEDVDRVSVPAFLVLEIERVLRPGGTGAMLVGAGRSGINFVYHPALSGDAFTPDITSDEFLSAPMDEDGFDFIHWFKETVSDGDFAVLMMNAKSAELNILVELFETGANLSCGRALPPLFGCCRLRNEHVQRLHEPFHKSEEERRLRPPVVG